MKNNRHNARKKKVQARKNHDTLSRKGYSSRERFEKATNQSLGSFCLSNIAEGNYFFAATNETLKQHQFGWLYGSLLDEVIEENAEDWSQITNTAIRLAVLDGFFHKATNASTAGETGYYQHLFYGAWFFWGDFTNYTHIGITIMDEEVGYEELSDFRVIELHEQISKLNHAKFRL